MYLNLPLKGNAHGLLRIESSIPANQYHPTGRSRILLYKQLVTELENLGVTPIEAVGKEFDPNLHNAVMQVESGEYESGIVAQELQKGYKFHDTVLRHSMVAVAQ